MFLDPENYWCIKEYVVTRDFGTVEATLEYGDKIAGFPVVRERTGLLIDKDTDKTFHKGILKVLRLARSSASESEFRLSAYGISEPDLDTLRSGRFHQGRALLYVSFASIGAVLAFFLWKKRRRERADG
jgi:hypothetical protein